MLVVLCVDFMAINMGDFKNQKWRSRPSGGQQILLGSCSHIRSNRRFDHHAAYGPFKRKALMRTAPFPSYNFKKVLENESPKESGEEVKDCRPDAPLKTGEPDTDGTE